MIEQNKFCEDRAKNKNYQFFTEKLDLLWLCWDPPQGSPKAIPSRPHPIQIAIGTLPRFFDLSLNPSPLGEGLLGCQIVNRYEVTGSDIRQRGSF